MRREQWSQVAHAGIEFMGPYDAASLERLFSGVTLPDAARVLDLGCGKGAVLAWLASRGSICGLGVDLVPCEREIPGVEFRAGDAAAGAGDGSYDLVCSIGAVTPLSDMVAWAKPGGLLLLGDGYWQREPSDEYLAALRARRDEMPDLSGLTALGSPLGLQVLKVVTSSAEQWDAYENAWADNGERYVREHNGEPGVEQFADWIGNGRRRYLELGGRETLGFAMVLFRRP